ncbi:MAG: hypothetical protein E7301_08230 [Butyrivibrio sp.]|nr:hypothetical protein [Butyrivibrio sp.]
MEKVLKINSKGTVLAIATAVMAMSISGCGNPANSSSESSDLFTSQNEEASDNTATEESAVEIESTASEAASTTENTENADNANAEASDNTLSAASDNIYSQYRSIVEQASSTEWDSFQLIDLDADGTPELFATCTDESRPDPGMQPYMIVGHNANGIVKNDEFADGVASAGGYRGTLYYIPGTGKLLDSAVNAPLGVPSDTIYEMKDGKIDYTVYGGFEVTEYPEDDNYDDWDPMEHGEWRWMDETVTEEEYKSKFAEATDNTHGVAMSEIDYMDKDSMLKELEKHMN